MGKDAALEVGGPLPPTSGTACMPPEEFAAVQDRMKVALEKSPENLMEELRRRDREMQKLRSGACLCQLPLAAVCRREGTRR